MSKNHIVGLAIACVLLAALALGNIAAVSAGKPTPTPPHRPPRRHRSPPGCAPG